MHREENVANTTLDTSLLKATANNALSFLEQVYALCQTQRYSGEYILWPQDVAQHTIAVQHIALWICLMENIRRKAEGGGQPQLHRGLVLEKALFHDLPEAMIGDVSYVAKHMLSQVGEVIGDLEELVVQQVLFQGLQETIAMRYQAIILADTDSEEAKIVRYADMIEVLCRIRIEIIGGNRHVQHVLRNGLQAMEGRRTRYPCVNELITQIEQDVANYS